MRRKVIITFLFLFTVYMVNSQDYSGKLNVTQLNVIEGLFSWEKEELIIINYRQPIRYCHYDQYISVGSTKWFDDFYSELNLKNTHNVFVYYESKRSEGIIDGKKHFFDLNKYLFNNFFNKGKSCYGLLIVNKNGIYQQKIGEYSKKYIKKYINKLTIKK